MHFARIMNLRFLSRLLATASVTLALGATSASAAAADFPNRPVTIVLPFTPGSAGDVVVRAVAERLKDKWQQPVIVDYKPGGNTMIATNFVAKARPDGHTLGVAGANLAANPVFFKQVIYDLRELQPVTQLVDVEMVIVARPDAPFSNLPELIAYSKGKPGSVNYGMVGVGSAYLGIEEVQKLGGFGMTRVGYRGTPESMTDLIGGRIDIAIDSFQPVLPYVIGNRMKIIATLGSSRMRAYPQFAALGESLPGVKVSPYLGIIGPAGVPRSIVDKIQADVAEALQSADLQQRLVPLGMTSVGSTPEQFDQKIKGDVARFKTIADALNIQPE